jgi:hypothetical protein
VLGLGTQNIPLSLLHPAGGPGCNLLANPDATMLLIPVNGVAVSQFAMPADPVYAGQSLYNQVLQIELDLSLNITRISSSNGLALMLGSF